MLKSFDFIIFCINRIHLGIKQAIASKSFLFYELYKFVIPLIKSCNFSCIDNLSF